MRDIGIIFTAEFLRKIRSRPFIIGTLVGTLAIVVLSALPSVLTHAYNLANRRIVLAGEPNLVASAARLLRSDFDIAATLARPVTAPTLADLNAHRKATAFVILERHARRLVITAYARDPGSFDQTLARDLIPLNIALATSIPIAQVAPYLAIKMNVKSLDAKFQDTASADAARGVAYLFVFLLYMSIVLNSQTIMASVAEEKTSRIAELLVATTSAADLLTGKILATGALGLIQLAVWMVAGLATGAGIVGAFGGHSTRLSSAQFGSGAIDIAPGVFMAFIVFFIIGYLQFATLYAAAASLINRTEDLGSVAAPLIVPVIGGFFLAQYALAFPLARTVAILSVVPLVAPFVMFTRLIVTTVPAWQIVTSLVINIVATVAIVRGAGKVYRVGLLLYGRPPSIAQVVAALRA